MNPTAFIGELLTVVVDRPLGSSHPTHAFVYPVNYGYIPGVFSGDGEELDAYVLGVDTALAEFTGRCIAVIVREDDDDPKLVVVPDGVAMCDEEIVAATRFQERYFRSRVVR